MLSRNNIKEAIAKGNLQIYPFEQKNLTGIGYNLSTTNFAFSISRGILLTIHQDTSSNGSERYVMIPNNDTVLFFSKEYVAVDETLAGTFHSKVARVCQGLGHISTTLDPTWKGQLIISVNNPTANAIRFELDKNSGNIFTLLLYKLDTSVTGANIHDNNQGRCDLLLEHFSKPFISKVYQEKHLELREFIVGGFADSLNGDDDFLDGSQIKDKYSERVTQLFQLQERFERDQLLFSENRYELGQGGTYNILRNDTEVELLKSCCIFTIINENSSLDAVSSNSPNKYMDTKPDFKQYLKVIDYELKTINHMRRVSWQNCKIEDCAGDDSVLVQLRKRELRNKKWKAVFVLVGILVVISAAIVALLWINMSPQIVAVAATICAPVLTFALQWWFKVWQQLKIDEGETK